MDATAKDAEIIILSDDEDEASENDTSCTESSLYIVEPDNMSMPGNAWTSFWPPVGARCVGMV